MKRLSIKEQILNLVFLLLLQLPLIHKVKLFDQAFAFFYVGFLLFLPTGLSRTYLMIVGFASGLLVDVFTNTPGMHALSCVLIMFLRNFWITIIKDDWREIGNINFSTLNALAFFTFLLPMVILHHGFLFFIENGGFHLFWNVIKKVIFSSFLTTIILFSYSYLISSRRGTS